jgi:hypothetical protein
MRHELYQAFEQIPMLKQLPAPSLKGLLIERMLAVFRRH